MSRDVGWQLDEKEFAEAIMAMADSKHTEVYAVINSEGQYLINKTYLRVRVVK